MGQQMVRARVQQGKRPFPYNDGESRKEAQPGETLPFEISLENFREFQHWLEPIDDQGNVLEELQPEPEGQEIELRAALPHERVGILQQRIEVQEQKLDRLRQQLAQAEQQAQAAGEQHQERQETRRQAFASGARNRPTGPGVASPTTGASAQPEPQVTQRTVGGPAK